MQQDYDLARVNYAAAAKQNFAPAQFLLAQLFENGKGTAVDFGKAYVLYARAARGNVPGAERRRDALKAQLNKNQRVEAEKLLAEDAPLPATKPPQSAPDSAK